MNNENGMTLVEVMIFIFLLSFLMAGFVRFSYSIYDQDIKLMNDINET